MIRRVAFRKAILAGVAGALAWEIWSISSAPCWSETSRPGSGGRPGSSLHAGVSAIWAIFYAYFFWSTFELPPAFQGLAFSSIPTVLTGVLMLLEIG